MPQNCCPTCMMMHYNDVIMRTMASQINSLTIVYSTVYSDADQRKHRSSASLAFVRGLHRSPVNSPHKGPVMRKFFPFHDVVMRTCVHLTPVLECREVAAYCCLLHAGFATPCLLRHNARIPIPCWFSAAFRIPRIGSCFVGSPTNKTPTRNITWQLQIRSASP